MVATPPVDASPPLVPGSTCPVDVSAGAAPPVVVGTALVQDLPIFARTALMVGHNPGFHALALYLANGETSDLDALRRLERKLPTAGLVHLEFATPWDEIGPGSARLAHYITPAMLGGVDED